MSTPNGPRSTAEVADMQERARRTLPIAACVLLAVVALYLPLPRRFVAVLPLVVAVVLSVRLLQFLRRRRGSEKIWPVVTLVMVTVLLASLVVQGVFYRTVAPYEQCVDTALTSQARADCEQLPGSRLLGGSPPDSSPSVGSRSGG